MRWCFIKDFETEKRKIINFVKESLRDNPLYEDLGDYIPFLTYYKEFEFCKRQIEILKRKMKYGMLYGVVYPRLRKFGRYLVVPEFNADSLLGLVEFYRLTGDEGVLEMAETMANSLNNYFIRGGHIYSLFLVGLKISVPFIRSINGLYMELLIDLYDLTKNENYLEVADHLAKAWVSLDFFRKYKLFPDSYFIKVRYLNTLWESAKTVTLFKHNTSVLNGLLAVHEKTKDERIIEVVDQWISTVKDRFFIDVLYGRLNVETCKLSQPLLKYSFSVIDLLCWAYHITKESKYLDFAENIASFWIERKSKINLFPEDLNKRGTLIDSITDFSVSLFRLNELTKKKFYKKLAINIVEANMKYHSYQPTKDSEFIGGRPCFFPAFVDSVDYETGQHLTKRVKPKFIALLLKPIIYLESGEKIYKNVNMFKLMRDR